MGSSVPETSQSGSTMRGCCSSADQEVENLPGSEPAEPAEDLVDEQAEAEDAAAPISYDQVGVELEEKESGIKFPGSNPDGLPLLGVGIRTKTFMKVKIYAVGLYGAVTSSWSNKQQRANRQLIANTVPKQVEFCMLREVTTDQMADAMDEMMQIPDEAEVKQAARQAKQQFKAALHQIFPNGKIKEHCRILLTAFPRDKNTAAGVRCTNNDTGSTNAVISPYLSEMLFDPFLGVKAECITPTLQKSVKENLPLVLERMAAKAIQNGQASAQSEQTAAAPREPKDPAQQSEKASGCTCTVM